ncbi:hypothetical protein [Varibaculum cambriense]|nr:hypothetical protein [Varibaculum cambriense]MDU5246723.1 hypothetical protein [Varibaculum cambriense]
MTGEHERAQPDNDSQEHIRRDKEESIVHLIPEPDNSDRETS